MPEGDTIFKAARTLRRALEGQTLVSLRAARLPAARLPRPGETITGVEARGKHLLVHFSGGLSLHTHMKMTGSWHLYEPGERWRKPEHLARAVVSTATAVAVCFSAPVVEMIRDSPRSARSRAHRSLTALGPDLCEPEPDIDAALERMRDLAPPASDIASVLLDQRIAAGIGNVFKSEVLWACRVHPFTSAGDVSEPDRRRLLETAAAQLRANLDTGRRTTVPGGLAVYGRARRPCRRCRTPIRASRDGAHPRVTYWCPTCQPEPGND